MFSKDLMLRIRIRKQAELTINLRRDMVIRNLIFLYHACVASEQLLIDAAQAATLLDGEANWLLAYYQSHLEEEKGEIEILKEDLASENIEPGLPDGQVMAMIGSQYYLLKHLHPICLLGYLAVQEADPTSLSTVESLENFHGKNLFRFLRLHAIKDLEHGEEINRLIDQAPEGLRHLIELSAENALDNYAQAVKMWRQTYG